MTCLSAPQTQKSKRGVNTVVPAHYEVSRNIFLFESIKYSVFAGNMPEFSRISLRLVFKVLLLVDLYPYKHKSKLKSYSTCSSETVSISLGYLLDHGYIKTSPHARLILPMDKWTFDTTYVITRSGKELIRLVFEVSGILGEK